MKGRIVLSFAILMALLVVNPLKNFAQEHGLWNGYLNQHVIAECVDPSDEEAVFSLETKDQSGNTIGNETF